MESYKASLRPAPHPPVTMKAVLLALLATGLALQPGEASASHGTRLREGACGGRRGPGSRCEEEERVRWQEGVCSPGPWP